MQEIALSAAIEGVATGATRSETGTHIARNWPGIDSADGIDRILRDALAEAQAQGVEREDIDPSWFGHPRSEDNGSNIVHP